MVFAGSIPLFVELSGMALPKEVTLGGVGKLRENLAAYTRLAVVYHCPALNAPNVGLHHRRKRRFAKCNQGFGGPALVTEVAVNFKIGMQRVRLNLCKSGLGSAYRARFIGGNMVGLDLSGAY